MNAPRFEQLDYVGTEYFVNVDHKFVFHLFCLFWQFRQVLNEPTIVDERWENLHEVDRAVLFQKRQILQDDVHGELVAKKHRLVQCGKLTHDLF